MAEAVPVVMVVQNQGVPQDVRVASFGRTLARAGYAVEIIAPARQGQAAEEVIDGYTAHRFPQPPDGAGVVGYAWKLQLAFGAFFGLGRGSKSGRLGAYCTCAIRRMYCGLHSRPAPAR